MKDYMAAVDKDSVLYQFLRPVGVGSATLPLLYVTFVAIILIPFLRVILIHTLFKPLGKALLRRQGSESDKKNKRVAVTLLEKWEMACWSFVFYIAATVSGIYVASREPWFLKPARLWYDCHSIPCQYPVDSILMLQYAWQLAYYIQAIPALYIWDLKRKDFYQMLAHHFVTIGLIVYSVRTMLVRAGVVILVTHDICDVLMEAAKLARYLEMTNAATAIFAVFVVTWIASRVFYFPSYLIWTCMVDSIGFIAIPYGVDPEPHYIFLNSLLIILFAIHIYWTFLILKIVWSVVVMKKDVDDVREDEEADKQKKE